MVKLENICASTCFRFIDSKLIYPSNISNLDCFIIYPTDGYYITKSQYFSIFDVIRKIQEGSYFISDIEFANSFVVKDNLIELGHMHIENELFDYDKYKNEVRLFENAIYDCSERWGISIFQDEFAIVCGDKDIIKEIKVHCDNFLDLKRFYDFIESAEITSELFRNELLLFISKWK